MIENYSESGTEFRLQLPLISIEHIHKLQTKTQYTTWFKVQTVEGYQMQGSLKAFKKKQEFQGFDQKYQVDTQYQ